MKLVKKSLKAITHDRLFTDESLHTFLCEVESITNSRPLTPNSDEPNDLETLTPNHFLLGHCSDNLSPGKFELNELECKRKWRSVQAATNMFWERFTKEYIPSLTTRSKWNKCDRRARKGDIVLITNEHTKRGNWPIARVIELIPGKDSVSRIAKLRTSGGEITRPVHKLCILENVRNDSSLVGEDVSE